MNLFRTLFLLLSAGLFAAYAYGQRNGLYPVTPVCPDSVVDDSFFWSEARDSAVKADGPGTGYPPLRTLRSERDLKKALLKWDERRTRLNLLGGCGLPEDSPAGQGASAIETAHDSWTLFLATGKAEYIDVFERAMYNGVRSALEGHESPKVRREAAKWMKAGPLFAYGVADSCIYVNFFTVGSVGIATRSIQASITQTGSYPWASAVQFWVTTTRPNQHFSLRIRIPGWARNEVLPDDKRFGIEQRRNSFGLFINEEPVTPTIKDGYIVIERTWSSCDRIHVHISAPIQRIRTNKTDGQPERGRFVYQRGPLVYAFPGSMEGYYIRAKDPVNNTFDNKKRQVFVFTTKRFKSQETPADAQAPSFSAQLFPYYRCMSEVPDSTTVWINEPH